MVTFPAGMTQQERNFISRQAELRDRLRWLDSRSHRARALRNELNGIIRAELAREVTPPAQPAKEPKLQWWQE